MPNLDWKRALGLSSKPQPPEALIQLLQKTGGGAHKRVDENRELLQLLRLKAPGLLNANPWIVGWLRANDEVFVELATMSADLGLHERFMPAPGFPRPWPIELGPSDPDVTVSE